MRPKEAIKKLLEIKLISPSKESIDLAKVCVLIQKQEEKIIYSQNSLSMVTRERDKLTEEKFSELGIRELELILFEWLDREGMNLNSKLMLQMQVSIFVYLYESMKEAIENRKEKK